MVAHVLNLPRPQLKQNELLLGAKLRQNNAREEVAVPAELG